MYSDLPNFPLASLSFSNQFKELGINTLHEACEYVWKLPYGRTVDEDDWAAVLKEGRGTCSSKHRLLKALADELNLEIELIIGIYPMTEKNTPGVGSILEASQYEFIPEAHCYLRYNGRRIDLTRANVLTANTIDTFFVEVEIEANQLSDFKQSYHYQYIVDNYGVVEASNIWHCREQCIAALST